MDNLALLPQFEFLLARRAATLGSDSAERGTHVTDVLELPLLLRSEFTSDDHAFYAMAGGYGSLLLRAQETDANRIARDIDIDSRADFGLLAAGGLSLASTSWGTLFAEVRYQRGYRNPLPNSHRQHEALSLLLGYGLRSNGQSPPPTGLQDRRLTLTGGLVATRLQSPQDAASAYRPGFAFGGAFAPAGFGSQLAIVPQLELAFVNRGGHSGPKEMLSGGTLQLEYVDVSALMRGEVTVADKSLYGLIGAYSSILVRAQQTHNGNLTNMRDAVRWFDAGWLAGAGVDIASMATAKIALELRYQQGLVDLIPNADQAATQQSVSCVIGIRYGASSRPTPLQDTLASDPTLLHSDSDRHDAQNPQPPKRVNAVRIGRVGDRWLSDLEFIRIEPAQRNDEYGYQVTYLVAGHGTLVLFWPRHQIDFEGESPGSRSKLMALHKGRLWYPLRLTSRSLPKVYPWVLKLEQIYAAQVAGAIAAMEGFAVVAGIGGAKPMLRPTGARASMSATTRTPRRPPARTPVQEAPKRLLPRFSISGKQFGKKVGKHAEDYGLDPSNAAHRRWVRDRIKRIVARYDEVRQGPWNPRGGGVKTTYSIVREQT